MKYRIERIPTFNSSCLLICRFPIGIDIEVDKRDFAESLFLTKETAKIVTGILRLCQKSVTYFGSATPRKAFKQHAELNTSNKQMITFA
jgi:hypothetical protein